MLTQILDHAARAVARLLFQFRDKPRIAGLMSTVGTASQEVEDGLYSLLAVRQIAVAQGVVLDQIAELVGAPARGARTDADYRERILAQIQINRGQGTLGTVYAVAALIAKFHKDFAPTVHLPWGVSTIVREGDVDALTVTHPPIGGYTIEHPDVDGDNCIDELATTKELARVLKNEVNPAGVRGIVLCRQQPYASSFGFAGSSGAGFGEGLFTAAYDGNQ